MIEGTLWLVTLCRRRIRLETDLKRVEELAREREVENRRFRSFLKWIDLDLGELDAIVHRQHHDVSGRIDCPTCGNCCRYVLPALSGSDVNRLASGLEMSEPDLRRRHLRAHEETGKLTFNATPCPLLSGNLCTAYEHRPSDCRSYPHLHKTEFVFRLIQAVENCSICPIVFNVFERLKEELWHEPDDMWEDGWQDSAEE